MQHGRIAARVIEEFLRVRAKSMPVVIYISDRPPGMLDGMRRSHTECVVRYSRYSATGDPASSRLSTIVS
jgi:hypothetical protein